ncbi:MAG: helix-turn-helix transcriptional regulator [Prevotella sp.]|nr:helix-turn-helix transcriptional regulator [Prevotella sp.]
MENNLSLSVRMLCRKQGITMRQLAEKMQIAPESLSRAINGNPQLSTIQSIASNLNVKVADLFNISMGQSDLTAIVVWRGETLVTDDINSLLGFVAEIKSTLQKEEIMENDINGQYHAK